MRKIQLLLLVFFLMISNTRVATAIDTIHMKNGSILEGKLDTLSLDLISFKTKNGRRTLTRLQVINYRDFVEIGLFKRKIVVGKIIYFNGSVLEIITPEGLLRVPSWKVRKVVIGQEPILGNLSEVELFEGNYRSIND